MPLYRNIIMRHQPHRYARVKSSRKSSVVVLWICIGFNADQIRIQGFEKQNWQILLVGQKFIFLIQIALHLSLGLLIGRSSYWRSLQSSKENIQHFKTYNFFTFSIYWVSFPSPKSGFESSRPKSIRIRIHNTKQANNFLYPNMHQK